MAIWRFFGVPLHQPNFPPFFLIVALLWSVHVWIARHISSLMCLNVPPFCAKLSFSRNFPSFHLTCFCCLGHASRRSKPADEPQTALECTPESTQHRVTGNTQGSGRYCEVSGLFTAPYFYVRFSRLCLNYRGEP